MKINEMSDERMVCMACTISIKFDSLVVGFETTELILPKLTSTHNIYI